MRVGCLGNIVFSVSANKVKTLNSLKMSGSAAFASHKRHCGDEILEFTGNNASTLSFSMLLSKQLGVDVEKELKKLDEYKRAGKTLLFTLGKKTYGNYRWVITQYSVSAKYFDKRGNVTAADVSVSLKEYNR